MAALETKQARWSFSVFRCPGWIPAWFNMILRLRLRFWTSDAKHRGARILFQAWAVQTRPFWLTSIYFKSLLLFSAYFLKAPPYTLLPINSPFGYGQPDNCFLLLKAFPQLWQAATISSLPNSCSNPFLLTESHVSICSPTRLKWTNHDWSVPFLCPVIGLVLDLGPRSDQGTKKKLLVASEKDFPHRLHCCPFSSCLRSCYMRKEAWTHCNHLTAMREESGSCEEDRVRGGGASVLDDLRDITPIPEPPHLICCFVMMNEPHHLVLYFKSFVICNWRTLIYWFTEFHCFQNY